MMKRPRWEKKRKIRLEIFKMLSKKEFLMNYNDFFYRDAYGSDIKLNLMSTITNNYIILFFII